MTSHKADAATTSDTESIDIFLDLFHFLNIFIFCFIHLSLYLTVNDTGVVEKAKIQQIRYENLGGPTVVRKDMLMISDFSNI